MIEWFAADQDTGSTLVDYFILAAPIALITAAIVNSWASIRTARKTPHEKLDLLISVRKVWPTELPGIETVNQSIELALAQVRRVDKLDLGPRATADEEEADDRASEIERAERWRYLARSAWYVFLAVGFFWTVGRTTNSLMNGLMLALLVAAAVYWVCLLITLVYATYKADDFPWQPKNPPRS
ncbi:hypothetical protein [Nocardia fluminea]|uniref:hypothetical protein n=1 Tax=Nocardia fluminea TaxID=134984 RepID=UPI0036497ED0